MCTKVILTVRVTSNKILVYGYISLNREGERYECREVKYSQLNMYVCSCVRYARKRTKSECTDDVTNDKIKKIILLQR